MAYYAQRIPDQSVFRAQKGARAHPLLLESRENKERGVNILEAGISGRNYYHREDNPPYMHRAPGAIPELYVREGVLLRLHLVNERLSTLGLMLHVFDAYRPVEVQNYFHDEWVPESLRKNNPEWSEDRIRAEVDMYWAKGFPTKEAVNPLSPPPHMTGGVVDLTLLRVGTKEEVYMGGNFDEVSPVSFADYFEQEAEMRELTLREGEARTNRRILYFAMTEAGFVVHPNEWWHFGFGDQLSAKNAGLPHAVYSVLPIPLHE